MNRFSDASLRGGIPKTNMKMKTYITPNTECTETRLMGAILLESGEGSKFNPGSGSIDPSKDLAPKRVF